MSFVWFEQLTNILKKAKSEKSKFAYFVRKHLEKELFFSSQPRSEVLFELESACHEEL